MTSEDRDHFANLILMCPNHHLEIDSLSPEKYSAEVLTEMKERAEKRSDKFEYSEIQLQKMAASLQLLTRYRDIAVDSLLDDQSSEHLTASASGLAEVKGASLPVTISREVFVASGSSTRTKTDELEDRELSVPFDRLKDLADVLLEMRHMFNIQHSQHDSAWVPAYGSPETLERTNLIQRLGVRLAPLDQGKMVLPITRSLATAFNWSSTTLEQAITEVKDLMVVG